MIGTVGSRYAREDKKKGIFGYKRFLVPVKKGSFVLFAMSVVVYRIVVPCERMAQVPFPHTW